MANNAKIISISLPEDMNHQVQQIAQEERRTVSEVFREAIRQYATTRAIAEVREQAGNSAKAENIKPEQIEDIIDEDRN